MSNSDSKRSRKKPIKPLSISSIHPSHIEPYFQKDLTKNPLRGDPVAEAKNCCGLGDIGNIASLPGVEAGKLNSPLTRYFRALLLENSNKKQINVAKKPETVQKIARAVVKPQPQPQQPHEVIVISSDTNEVAKAKQDQRDHDALLLPRLLILIPDKDNDLAAAMEYVEDMAFYKEIENESRPQMYMQTHIDINEKMRSILVDWLETRELQLLGVSVLLIASKYEEIWPQVNYSVYVTDNSYQSTQILVMEKTILGNLKWYLRVPTKYVFLARFTKAANPDPEMENMVHFEVGSDASRHFEVTLAKTQIEKWAELNIFQP
uniref:Cyclin N-terminal domain-containing protein n=1 Tax=Brassica oleracea var. oleracea TaxID=109376 RepID=A0A0D3CDL8_BRAOL